jgi:hypothetical protein
MTPMGDMATVTTSRCTRSASAPPNWPGVATILEATPPRELVGRLVRLPAWVFGLLLGREWLVEAATVPVMKPATALFPCG